MSAHKSRRRTTAINLAIAELPRSLMPNLKAQNCAARVTPTTGPLGQIVSTLSDQATHRGPAVNDSGDTEVTASSADSTLPALTKKRSRRPALSADLVDHQPDFEPRRALARTMAPRLIRAREEAGLRQGDASQAIGYANQAQMALWERGTRLMPLLELPRLAALYGVPESFLLGTGDDTERDPARGLRAASVRGIRGLLDNLAERLVDEIGRHAQLVGPGVVHVRALLASGRALLDAAQDLQRLNHDAFDDLRGGATFLRLVADFEAGLQSARAGVDRFDALDQALRVSLAERDAPGSVEQDCVE